MLSTGGLDSAQISGLVKEMAPMVASMVAQELLKEGGHLMGGPRKRTNKRKVHLKDGIKVEKEAEDSRERNIFLVSGAHLNH